MVDRLVADRCPLLEEAEMILDLILIAQTLPVPIQPAPTPRPAWVVPGEYTPVLRPDPETATTSPPWWMIYQGKTICIVEPGRPMVCR